MTGVGAGRGEMWSLSVYLDRPSPIRHLERPHERGLDMKHATCKDKGMLDVVVVTTADPFYLQHDDESWKHEKATTSLVVHFIASLPG
jgi:hypothetical protein